NPADSGILDLAVTGVQTCALPISTDVVVTYQVSDGLGGTDTATLTITVTGVNDAPDAVNDVGSGTEDTTILGTVASNDTDVDDGHVLSYSVVGSPPAGRSEEHTSELQSQSKIVCRLLLA